MAIGPTGELDCTMRPLAHLRWFAHHLHDHSPKLQQAWSQVYGGQIEWRDVPLAYGTYRTTASGLADHGSPKPDEKSPVPALQEGERDAARDAVCRAAKVYYTGYAQDEAADGEHADAGKDGPYTGCSSEQARDALALREALAALEALEQQDEETR